MPPEHVFEKELVCLVFDLDVCVVGEGRVDWILSSGG